MTNVVFEASSYGTSKSWQVSKFQTADLETKLNNIESRGKPVLCVNDKDHRQQGWLSSATFMGLVRPKYLGLRINKQDWFSCCFVKDVRGT